MSALRLKEDGKINNREIKFRAWNPDTKQIIDLHKLTPLAVDPKLTDIQDGLYIPLVDKWPLMQFTGLKDKNGVEIYEGDIISGKFNGQYIERVYWKGEPDIIAEVYWDYSGFRLKAKGEKDQRYADFHDFLDQQEWDGRDLVMLNNDHTEVIGNIYENPELLK